MPILTPPRALPGLLMSIARFVEEHGAIEQPVLFDLVVPQPLRKSEVDGRSVAASKNASVASSGLAPERFLLEWVLSDAMAGEDPFAGNEHPTADFARTLCWFLDLDPMDAPVFTGQNKDNAPQTRLDSLVSDAKLVKRLSVVDAAWSSFARWATYLGLARVVGAGRAVGVLPDPYVAIRRIASDALGARPDALAAFFARIGERIPAVGGGRLARCWHELYAVDDERDVSPALAYALFRLHDEGAVRLTHVGDADVVWRFRFGRRTMPGYDGPVAPQTLTFSHIGRGA
jgi:hypothetical protein